MCCKEETSSHRAYMCCMWYQEIWQRWQCHISLHNLRRYEYKEQCVFAHAYGILNRNFQFMLYFCLRTFRCLSRPILLGNAHFKIQPLKGIMLSHLWPRFQATHNRRSESIFHIMGTRSTSGCWIQWHIDNISLRLLCHIFRTKKCVKIGATPTPHFFCEAQPKEKPKHLDHSGCQHLPLRFSLNL